MQYSQILGALLLLWLISQRVNSLPLSTHGRWIIDSTATNHHRVKLRCVNWAGHMPAVVPEGLNRQPLRSIAMLINSLGFNCIRLTWATQLWTNDDLYGRLTVGESLRRLGLEESLRGVARNNPRMVRMKVRDAYEEVVRAVGEAGVMVVLDNHVSRPGWCCGREDGNGFFGDMYFDVDEWVRGLEIVANRFRGFPQVVGMSMRNELRGPNQTQPAWYRNIARGAHTIHNANPDVLIIASGLSFDTDLSFLGKHPLLDHYNNKLVLEAHWYAFSEGRKNDWADKPITQMCPRSAQRFDERAGFVGRMVNGTVPLFVSEFGGDQRGTSRADDSFLSCFMAFAAERDLDWALWALQGSYYWRNGVEGFEETFGVLDADWNRPKNPKLRERFRLIQQMLLQDPRSSTPVYQLIFHPPSGQCLFVDKKKNVLLNDCAHSAKWKYKMNGTSIELVENSNNSSSSPLCLRPNGDGQPLVLSDKCNDVQSLWRVGSSSGFGLIGKDSDGRDLCMEKDSASNSSSSVVLTGACVCLHGSATCSDDDHDPRQQWFKIVSSNVG